MFIKKMMKITLFIVLNIYAFTISANKIEPCFVSTGFTQPNNLENLIHDEHIADGTSDIYIFKDTNTSIKYVLKFPSKNTNNPDHLKEEIVANAIYLELGVKIPPFAVYKHAPSQWMSIIENISENSPFLLSLFIEGEHPKDIDRLLEPEDIVIANYNLYKSNIIRTSDNELFRIDQNGSLRFCNLGEVKTDFGPYLLTSTKHCSDHDKLNEEILKKGGKQFCENILKNNCLPRLFGTLDHLHKSIIINDYNSLKKTLLCRFYDLIKHYSNICVKWHGSLPIHDLITTETLIYDDNNQHNVEQKSNWVEPNETDSLSIRIQKLNDHEIIHFFPDTHVTHNELIPHCKTIQQLKKQAKIKENTYKKSVQKILRKLQNKQEERPHQDTLSEAMLKAFLGKTYNETDSNQNIENILQKSFYKKYSKDDINLIQKILQNEKENINDVVAYHGTNAQICILFMIFKKIKNELLLENDNYQNCLRGYDQLFDDFDDIDDFIDYMDTSYTNWTDHHQEAQPRLLSTNIGLFGNLGHAGEETLSLFFNGLALSPPKPPLDMLKKYLEDLNIYDDAFIQACEKFFNEWADKGALFQFFIPNSTADNIAYICRAVGDKAYLKNDYDQKLVKPSNIIPFIKKNYTSKLPLEFCDLNNVQMRLFLHPRYMNDIKSFIYLNNDEDAALLEKKIDNLIEKFILKKIYHINTKKFGCKILLNRNRLYEYTLHRQKEKNQDDSVIHPKVLLSTITQQKTKEHIRKHIDFLPKNDRDHWIIEKLIENIRQYLLKKTDTKWYNFNQLPTIVINLEKYCYDDIEELFANDECLKILFDNNKLNNIIDCVMYLNKIYSSEELIRFIIYIDTLGDNRLGIIKKTKESNKNNENCIIKIEHRNVDYIINEIEKHK